MNGWYSVSQWQFVQQNVRILLWVQLVAECADLSNWYLVFILGIIFLFNVPQLSSAVNQMGDVASHIISSATRVSYTQVIARVLITKSQKGY